MEIWKPVAGHEGVYEVSSEGRIRSLDQEVRYVKKGRVLRPGRSSNGYPSVVLAGRDSRTLHSIVAAAFHGPCPTGMQIRHLDGSRDNAKADNLKYGTPAENGADTVRHSKSVQGSAFGRSRLTEAKARRIRRMKGRKSQSALAAEYGVSSAAIQAIHDGRTWKHA